MTMSLWLTPADLRDYMGTTLAAGRYADAPLGSNIRAAQSFIERETGRQFEVQTGVTKVFTSGGRAAVPVPDLASTTAITLQDTTLTATETYWLIEDVRHSGVYVAVQVRPFGGNDYRSNPQWFDRNLDRSWSRDDYSLPNDLSVAGDWGWTSKPDDVLLAVKAYAAWLTKRADAVLANAVQNPDGSILDYSRIPEETARVIKSYMRGAQMVSA